MKKTHASLEGRNLSVRLTAMICCALTLASLLPMLAVAFDNRPYFDDFGTGGQFTRSILEQTGSFGALMLASFSHAAEFYGLWEGNYVANYLNSMQLGVIDARLACVTTFAMLLALIFASYRLCRAVMGTVLGQGRAHAWIATALLTFVSVQLIPYPNEAFFWESGAVKYTLGHAAMLLTAALAIELGNGASKRRVPKAVMLSLLGFLCAGFNLLTGITTLVGLGLYALTLLPAKRRGRCAVSLAAAFTLIGFAINFAAPGNAARNNNYINPSIVTTVVKSVYGTVELMGGWSTLPMTAFALMVGCLVYPAAKRSEAAFSHPIWMLIASFGALAAQLAPSIYTGTYYTLGRLADTTFLSFCLWVTLNAAYLSGWLAKRSQRESREPHGVPVALLLTCAVMLAVGCIGYGLKKTSCGASLDALTSGQAARYAQSYDERAELLTTSTEEPLQISPITDVPLVFMNEENSWHSVCAVFGQYYGKQIAE